ncbi:hypothetical protein MBLNU457_4869t1 [Dothideomycetes sp. NU457]
MVSILQRMRKLQTLLAIKLGSGAAILPKDVARIHMRFARRIEGGHMGPRKFWRHELVRLKYHNPAIPMTIDRSATQDEDAIMTVHFTTSDAQQSSGSATGAPAPTGSTSGDKAPSDHASTVRTETISMTNRLASEILADLLRITKAVTVEATPEEREQLEMLEEMRIRSEKDSALGKEVRAKRKREEALLAQARGEIAADMDV